MMKNKKARDFLSATCMAACLVGTTEARAVGSAATTPGAMKLLTTIAVPGNPLASYDISSVDPVLDRYFLSDRSNAALDIVDTQTNRVIGQVTGFTGPAGGNNNLAGPDGNTPTGDGLVWVGNGDSTVKVVDSRSMTIVQSVSTGGTMRADEMAYDAKDKCQSARKRDPQSAAKKDPSADVYGAADGWCLNESCG